MKILNISELVDNFKDRNYPLVLSNGACALLKLCNDTLIFIQNALKELLECVRNNQKEKPVLFTSNNNKYLNEIKVNSLEDFLYQISFNITSIGGFSFWKEDFDILGNTNEGCDESLWQVTCLSKYVNKKKNVIVYNKRLFTIRIVKKKKYFIWALQSFLYKLFRICWKIHKQWYFSRML